MRQWFWFGLLTSSAYLVSYRLIRMGLHPSAAAALSALVGTSVALVLTRLLVTRRAVPTKPLAIVSPRSQVDDLTPVVLGLGLAGTPAPRSLEHPELSASDNIAADNDFPVAASPTTDFSADVDTINTDAVAAVPPASEVDAGSRDHAPVQDSLLQELLPLGFHSAVDEFKRRLLSLAIESCDSNRAEAARRLGLQRTYLYRLAKQLNCAELSRPEREDQAEAQTDQNDQNDQNDRNDRNDQNDQDDQGDQNADTESVRQRRFTYF